MTQIAKQLTGLIGNTPLLELNRFSAENGLERPVVVKVEFFNRAAASRTASRWRWWRTPNGKAS